MEAQSAPELLTKSEIWSGERLALILGYYHQGARSATVHVNAHQVARSIGVTPGTVRRWVRNRFPAKRIPALEELVLPSLHLIEQEERELSYARAALQEINEPGRAINPLWEEQRWLEPHVLGIVKFENLRICVPRISRSSVEKKVIDRARAGKGIVEKDYLFGNRFSAQVAKGELLDSLAPWRLVLAHGILPRGRTEAWIMDAPLPKLAWMPMTQASPRI